MSVSIRDYRKTKIMLLGPGDFVDFRREVKKKLKEFGYPEENVIIMEDIDGNHRDISLDDKFKRITDQYNPDIYITFFHNNTKIDSVVFEIGWLCCKFGIHHIGQRLRFLHEPRYNWKERSAYLSSLFITVTQTEFEIYPHKEYLSAPSIIHQIASINNVNNF